LRLIVTGTDAEGKSAVLRVDDLEDGVSTTLWTTSEAPPHVDRPAPEPAFDSGCGPSSTSWRIWSLAPGSDLPLHRTNTLDHDTVLEGEATLVLEAGEIDVHAGDCIVIPDVLHGWRSGARGLVASLLLVGLDPV
jgi:quercetin dioxygenase-like cupin family protein